MLHKVEIENFNFLIFIMRIFRDVAHVIAAVKGEIPVDLVIETCYRNTVQLFFAQQ